MKRLAIAAFWVLIITLVVSSPKRPEPAGEPSAGIPTKPPDVVAAGNSEPSQSTESMDDDPAPPGPLAEPTEDEGHYMAGMKNLVFFYIEEKAGRCGLPNSADYYLRAYRADSSRLATQYHISDAYIAKTDWFWRKSVRGVYNCKMLAHRHFSADGSITFPMGEEK